MAFRDLREFLTALEARRELKRITAPVSTDLEAAEIADRAVKAGGPALLFENVKGPTLPLALKLFATVGRVGRALGGPQGGAAGLPGVPEETGADAGGGGAGG